MSNYQGLLALAFLLSPCGVAFAHGDAHVQDIGGSTPEPAYAHSVPSYAAWLDIDRCEKQELSGCHAYADRLHGGVGVERDHRRAVELYESNCESGFAYSCYNMAARYWLGEGVELNPEAALELFERACIGEVSEACYMWSVALEADGGADAMAQVPAVRARGCALGMAVLCEDPAPGTIDKTLGAWVAELGADELRTVAGACEGGSARACAELAFGLEEAGHASFAEVEELHRSACDWGVLDSCQFIPSEER